MKSYERILRAVYATPWFIERSKLDAIVGFLELKAAGSGPSEETLAAVRAASAAAADRSIARQSGAVAVLPLMGLITHRGNMMGDISGPRGTSVEKFTAGFRQALNDPNVKAIVIDVDSPGGSVDGVDELASEIFQARGKKPMTAIANTLMASAAYYIGSAADELVVTPSGLVGSIGVYMAHTDTSEKDAKDGVKTTVISAGKYKAEGAAGKPLGEDGIAYAQSVVDSFYEQFVKAVARGRGVSAAAVRSASAKAAWSPRSRRSSSAWWTASRPSTRCSRSTARAATRAERPRKPTLPSRPKPPPTSSRRRWPPLPTRTRSRATSRSAAA
jgi:signal peptide peptidase SppA